jgi:hypothetical protein
MSHSNGHFQQNLNFFNKMHFSTVVFPLAFFHLCSQRLGVLVGHSNLYCFVLFRFWNLDLNHRFYFFPFSLIFSFFHLSPLLTLIFFSSSTSFLRLLFCCCLLVASLHYLLTLPYALHVASHIRCLLASCICHLVASHTRCFVTSRATSLPRYLITSLPCCLFYTTSLPLLDCLIMLPLHFVALHCHLVMQLCYLTCYLVCHLIAVPHYHRVLPLHATLLPQGTF